MTRTLLPGGRRIAEAGIELVVTDLDGTLWDAGERIHDRTLEALQELEQRKVPLLVATGRRQRSAARVLAASGLTPPAVFLDGAIGRDLADGRVFHEAAFTAEVAAAVLAGFRAAGLEPCIYVDRSDADVVVGAAPSTHPDHLEMIGRWLARDDLDRVVATERIFGFGIYGRDRALLEAGAAGVDGIAGVAVTRDLYYGGASMTVRAPQVSKWAGVVAFCYEQDIDPGNVLAVGDAENDLELLAGARVACVVRDGCDAALALADHVIDPAADGGWCAILDLC